MLKLPSLTIFYPCYNDGGTIATMIIRGIQIGQMVAEDYEILVINDGSQDDSYLILEEMVRLYSGKVRVIHEEHPSGYGGVLRKGFAQAKKDWIFYTDGDAQYDPRELQVLVESLHSDVDMVNGYKIKRHDPLHRVWIGLAYQYFVKIIFGLVIRDVDCDFRLLRRAIFDRVHLESKSGTIGSTASNNSSMYVG
jgi:glycosyltransferase involved in cell wall biosynthesis